MLPDGSQFIKQLLDRGQWRARLVLALGGAAMPIAFAPFDLWWLVPFLLLPLLLAAQTCKPRDMAWLGFSYGAGMFVAGTYWITISIHVFGKVPLIFAILLMLVVVLVMALWLAACGWLLARLASGSPARWLLLAPAIWVLVEWLRGWVLSGFPWLSLGYSQVDSPLGAWLPVLGVYGVSWLAALSAAALALAWVSRWDWRALLLALLPWATGLALQGVAWTEPAGQAIRATVVQGGVSQDQKWLPEQFQKTLHLYRNALLAARDSDIIVWPEVAIPALDTQVEPYIALLERDLRPRQSLLFGILEQEGDAIYNSLVKLDAAGRQVYRKRHLVPFGEYFPVPGFVREWMRLLSLPHSDLQAGSPVQPLLTTVGGQRLATAICYEDAYGSEQLYAFPDATLIVNVSNDAWFGDSIAPHQHLQIARVRAREMGRYALRSTNNGISVVIGPDGAELARAPQFELATLTYDVQPMRGATPYARLGNGPLLLLAAVLVGLAGFQRRRTLHS